MSSSAVKIHMLQAEIAALLSKVTYYENLLAAQYSPPDAPAAATTATDPAAWEADWLVEGYFGDNTQEYKCRHCGTAVRAASADAADDEHGACPRGRGYVYQD
jgi:hypothetical protein